MPVVDERFVEQYLRATVPGLKFQAQSADSEAEDAEVKISRGDQELPVSVQVGGGYVCLNRYGYSRPGDPGSFYMVGLGSWGVQPADLLELAKAVNLEAVRLAKEAA